MKQNRTTRQPEILLEVDRTSGAGPMRQQIENALREAVQTGRLLAGNSVPSTRTLARDLGVSRGVVTEAYEQLIAEGYLVTLCSVRTTVAAFAHAKPVRVKQPPATRYQYDFRPGVPDLLHFPVEPWIRSMRRALRRLRAVNLDYGDPLGTAELRVALADYLARVRGVVASPESILISTGFAQGLGLVARSLIRHGIAHVAVEDPSHPEMRRILLDAGLNIVGVPVDEHGVRVDLLTRTGARAVLLTPAHQFPTGCVLSAPRRRELLVWTSRADAYVIEDDYDAEYRYDRNPIGALHGLEPERVIYAGSASKILAPALRLGWIVAPQSLAKTLQEVKRAADLGSPVLDQLVYADFLCSGELDRHLRRMRLIYQDRRDALLASLKRHCPAWKPQGAAAGLHLVAQLPPGLGERNVVRKAHRQSVRLYSLRSYAIERHRPAAIVLGYGGLSEREIAAAISRLGG